MEKAYALLLEDENEHENVTALDDFLNPERQEATHWSFKNDDLLLLDGSRGQTISVNGGGDTISEPLEDVSYLDGMYLKPENLKQEYIEATTPSTSSYTFENLDSELKHSSVELQERANISCSTRKSEMRILLANDPSRSPSHDLKYEPPLEYNVDCSENYSSVAGDVAGDLEDKLRSMQADYRTSPENLKDFSCTELPVRKEIQKPPKTKGIGLQDLMRVFHLERPKAEKKLRLKRTTFSNLCRHYGISKWPFRTIRDAINRREANDQTLRNRSLSKSRSRKLAEEQMNLRRVIDLIYADPRTSRDNNTLGILLNAVANGATPRYTSL